MEKERGIPVQMLNDRDKVNRPNSQALEMDKGGLLVKHDGGLGRVGDRRGQDHFSNHVVGQVEESLEDLLFKTRFAALLDP